MMTIVLALNDSVGSWSETVWRLPCSSTLQSLCRLRQVGSILKLQQNIRRCVEVEAQVRNVIVACCTSGARPGSIARSGTKVLARWHHVVHILYNTLLASTTGRDPTESTLSFLKLEHKYTINWSFSFFLMTARIRYL
jgi:hypothetical protein